MGVSFSKMGVGSSKMGVGFTKMGVDFFFKWELVFRKWELETRFACAGPGFTLCFVINMASTADELEKSCNYKEVDNCCDRFYFIYCMQKRQEIVRIQNKV